MTGFLREISGFKILPVIMCYVIIMKTCPCNIQRCFRGAKVENFPKINLIFAQNIDYGYTLELPCQGGSNEYPQSIIGIPLYTQILLFKIGVQWGILFTHMFS